MWKLIESNNDGYEKWILTGLNGYALEINVYGYGEPIKGIAGYPRLPKSKWKHQAVLYKYGSGGFNSVSITKYFLLKSRAKSGAKKFMLEYNTPEKVRNFYKRNR